MPARQLLAEKIFPRMDFGEDIPGETLQIHPLPEFWFKFLHVFTINLQMEEVVVQKLDPKYKGKPGLHCSIFEGIFLQGCLAGT